MNAPQFIRCEGLWKIFHEARPHEVRALADLNVTVERGSFTVFSGPSGSGKTTLLSIIGTIERPSRGRVFLDGKDVTGFSEEARTALRRKRIGFVFQNFNLLPGLPAWENVSVPLIPEGVGESERKRRAMQLLEKINLSDRAGQPPEELSGGEQQRVAVARALINNPDIVILDEPTSNIDSEAVSLLMGILMGLKAEGRTILASSHDSAVFQSADVIFELKRGSLTGSRTP